MTDHRDPIHDDEVESLFVWDGGRFSETLTRFRLADGDRLHPERVAAFVAAVTWLPLLLLAVVEGVAWGERVSVPLLKDFLPYAQFLVAAPVLVLGDAIVSRRLGQVAAELRRSDILPSEDTPELDRVLAGAAAWWRGRSVNFVLLLLTLAGTGATLWGAPEWLTGGWQFVGGGMTTSGWWYLLFSAPVLRFLTLRWLWRALLWAWVLWRTSRLRLRPRPSHPDRAGGLAFLGATQASFGVLVFAAGVQLSSLIADSVCYQGADLTAYRSHVTAFVLIVVSSLLLPLVPFAPKLVRAKGDGLVFLSGSGYDGAVHLERELRAYPSEGLPTDHISGLADFGALYDNARSMKPLPVDLRHILVLVFAALLPFAPLFFLVMPAQEVFQTLVKLVV